jgi:hypothetical protein
VLTLVYPQTAMTAARSPAIPNALSLVFLGWLLGVYEHDHDD